MSIILIGKYEKIIPEKTTEIYILGMLHPVSMQWL
jgi:hypothetical protein